MVHAGFCSLMSACMISPITRPWHGSGAEELARMGGIVPNAYLCPRTRPGAHRLRIEDGDVFAGAWEHVPWTSDFVDIEGDAKPLPSKRTRMKMMWDDEALYVGAYMEEPQVVATLTERNSVVFQDNDFEFFIDPDGSSHQYYEFEVNALNTVWELRLDRPYRHGGSEHSERVGMTGQGSLAGLTSGVKVFGGAANDPPGSAVEGWSVTVAFPFADLVRQGHCRRPPRAGDVWRANASRVQWLWEWAASAGGGTGEWRKTKREGQDRPTEDNWVWSPQGLVNMHLPEMWGFLQFEGDPGAYPPPRAGGGGEGALAEWPSRRLLIHAHWLIPDFVAAHSRLPSGLEDLGLVAPEGTEGGVAERGDLPGGYQAWVAPLGGGEVLSVRGDALVWRDTQRPA